MTATRPDRSEMQPRRWHRKADLQLPSRRTIGRRGGETMLGILLRDIRPCSVRPGRSSGRCGNRPVNHHTGDRASLLPQCVRNGHRVVDFPGYLLSLGHRDQDDGAPRGRRWPPRMPTRNPSWLPRRGRRGRGSSLQPSQVISPERRRRCQRRGRVGSGGCPRVEGDGRPWIKAQQAAGSGHRLVEGTAGGLDSGQRAARMRPSSIPSGWRAR